LLSFFAVAKDEAGAAYISGWPKPAGKEGVMLSLM